jgi:hypothetical protein
MNDFTKLCLFLLMMCFSCTERKVVLNIDSHELINLDYNSLTKLDSVTAYDLLNEYPVIYNWPQTLELLNGSMPKKYLVENLDYEEDKAIKDFLEKNYLFNYSVKVNEEVYRGIITKSASEPEQWAEEGYYLNLYLIEIKNKLKQPILINSYTHDMGVTSWEEQSITHIYDNHSIKVIMKSDQCSDVEIDGKTSCDSTLITNFYKINTHTKEIEFSSDTIKYDY